MKKNIAYYLEDPSRLSEISMYELSNWVEEMPYSQPLRLLVDMKREEYSSVSDPGVSYGAFFAEDYEPLSKKQIKKLAKKKLEKEEISKDLIVGQTELAEQAEVVESADLDLTSGESIVDPLTVVETEMEEASSGILPLEETAAETIEEPVDETTVEPLSETTEEVSDPDKHELAHSLVDDYSEDIVESDMLETNPNVVLVNEVSHEDADEMLEDALESEVLEITLGEVEEVSSFTELDVDSESNVVEEVISKDQYEGLVDYKAYVIGVEDENLESSEEESCVTEAGIESNAETVSDEQAISEEEVIVDKIDKKKKKKSKSKVDDSERTDVKQKKKSKKKAKKKSIKGKKNKVKQEAIVKSKKDKKKADKKDTKSRKKVKNLKGDITKKKSKSKSIKGKAKIIKNKVKYVVVNEATSPDFKMKDFDGVSSYTNWLLEQESINGSQPPKESKKKVKVLAKKKKSKKKGKKKKNKVLKVAQDSIKKSQMIISEPLANILAAQGHYKKAKKMYKQLGLIFPEKSGYFADQIKAIEQLQEQNNKK